MTPPPDTVASSRLFVVGGGPLQLGLIRTAKAMGARVAVADRDPEAPGLALADAPVIADLLDLAAMVEAAERFGAEGVVTAASDAATPAVAAIAAARAVPGLAPEVVARCQDKLTAFERVGAAGLEVPRTHLLPDEAAADAVAKAVGGYPVVVKPRAACGGRGVSVVRDRSGLEGAFERAARYGGEVVVQRFVAGHAVSVEAFFAGGAPIAAFVMDDQFVPGFGPPVGHAFPSELPASLRDELREAVGAYADALGVTEGPASFELRVEQGRPVLLNVGVRLGGNAIDTLIQAAYGVDLAAATILAALGRDPGPALRTRPVVPAASRLAVSRARGVATVDADAIASVAAAEDVVALELAVRDGAPSSARIDDHALLGRCVVRGSTALEAVRRAGAVGRAIERAVTVAPSDD